MNQTVSPAKSAMTYGVVFGAIMVLELVIMYILKPDPIENAWAGTVMQVCNFLIFPVLFISLACNNYKKNINGGFISFGQCLKIGVSVMVLASVIYSIFYVVFTLMFPEFLTDAIEQVRRVTVQQNPNMTEEQLEMTTSMTAKFMQPMLAVPISIIMNAFVGLIYSLIIGAIVKRDNPAIHN